MKLRPWRGMAKRCFWRSSTAAAICSPSRRWRVSQTSGPRENRKRDELALLAEGYRRRVVPCVFGIVSDAQPHPGNR